MGAADARSKLLAAGRQEFARHGLSGARVDRIATAAGVNKERIYGYFGSKNGLFDAVLDEAIREITDVVPFSGADLPDYVTRVRAFHQRQPDLLRLLLWDALERSVPFEEDDARRGVYRDKVADFAGHLGRPADARTGALLYGAIGLAAWPLLLPRLRGLLTGTDDASALRLVAAVDDALAGLLVTDGGRPDWVEE